MDKINEKLLLAFKEKDLNTIIEELTPLFYKHMKGVPPSVREDVLQELKLNCIHVVIKYELSNHYIL